MVITGHKGYIGSRLHKELPQAKGIDLKEGKDILWCDLPEGYVVYHLAAQAGAIPSIENPLQDAWCNIMATLKIIERYRDSKIIFTTSGAALKPESPYGVSKQAAERYLQILAENAVVIRLSSVYGEKDRGVVDTFIRENPIIYGDGTAVRDFVHVDDIVRGLVLAKTWKPGIYEMGSGKGTTVKEIAEATGKPIKYRPARKGEVHTAVLKNTTPNWQPSIDVLDYVVKYS